MTHDCEHCKTVKTCKTIQEIILLFETLADNNLDIIFMLIDTNFDDLMRLILRVDAEQLAILHKVVRKHFMDKQLASHFSVN